MTDIYIELGGKKAIAWSLEWPGWCRIRTGEEAALQALIDTEARYRLIAQRAGQVVAASPAELRKGPRGGGRNRDEIRCHVIEAERVYARKIGVRHKPFEVNDLIALKAMREEIAAVLSKHSTSEPLVSGGWNASYAVRRMAWHVVDHIWEIEDRRS